MKLGIIKERKTPPDRRVVFTPEKLAAIAENYPDITVKAEASDIRIFKDEEYVAAGIEVGTDMTDCDVLIGVKEVPAEALIPNKKYFFFSHTIKKQHYNQKLLQTILDNNIELYDHETIVDANNKRLIGFGRYAGNVGAYNTIRAFGIKYEIFKLPKAETLPDRTTLIDKLKSIVLPPVKIVLTGRGKVAMGAKEMLDGMKMKEVAVNDYLTKSYDRPVYTQIDVLDYNKRKDGTPIEKQDFYNNPLAYESNFERFANTSDILITGHFFGNNAPDILTQDMLKSHNNKIKVVGDVSCDIAGPIACTLRPSTIAEPIYGYNPATHEEVDIYHPSAVVVMAVDNLPCELPRDASMGFAEMFYDNVIPAFFNGDKDGILERAKITENGKLTERFKYLSDFVEER
ncbi:NAD(P)-dependent oxidoreductase [Flavobacterium litorale]|uniref:Saccharopine dehydrogenase [NAD(+), L-lysine-forming] n=1 Tax=Flavobacterium litorale TaxID=2856519 RepID=A0ABX8V9S1_9FLAO|nr:NAD(P)-dependent oxidoreductase [Flavobacterium litorale]QYJ67570.1 NAD(P)-dependent oxidoreductase [Flavobacterium litorale]